MQPAPLPCHGSLSFCNHFYTPSFSTVTCPHFTDGKTHIPHRSHSQEVAELEGGPRLPARIRGYLMKE